MAKSPVPRSVSVASIDPSMFASNSLSRETQDNDWVSDGDDVVSGDEGEVGLGGF